MSQEWVDLVRDGFAALERGDLAAFDGLLTPDVILVQPPEVPDAKSYAGPDAIAEAMEDWPRQWEDFRMDLIEIIDVGDEVAVSVTRHRGRGRESGIEMDFEVFYVHRGRGSTEAAAESLREWKCSSPAIRPSKPPGCRSSPAITPSPRRARHS
jgi:ketosteroid isomerase-like protein